MGCDYCRYGYYLRFRSVWETIGRVRSEMEGLGVLYGVRGSDWWWLVIRRGDKVMMMRWRHDGWESVGDELG